MVSGGDPEHDPKDKDRKVGGSVPYSVCTGHRGWLRTMHSSQARLKSLIFLAVLISNVFLASTRLTMNPPLTAASLYGVEARAHVHTHTLTQTHTTYHTQDRVRERGV